MAVHIQPFVVISSNAYGREHAPVGAHADVQAYTERTALLDDGEVSPRGRTRYRSDYGSSRSSDGSLRTLRPTPAPTPVHSPRFGTEASRWPHVPPASPQLADESQEAAPGRWARLRAVLAAFCCFYAAAEPLER